MALLCRLFCVELYSLFCFFLDTATSPSWFQLFEAVRFSGVTARILYGMGLSIRGN